MPNLCDVKLHFEFFSGHLIKIKHRVYGCAKVVIATLSQTLPLLATLLLLLSLELHLPYDAIFYYNGKFAQINYLDCIWNMVCVCVCSLWIFFAKCKVNQSNHVLDLLACLSDCPTAYFRFVCYYFYEFELTFVLFILPGNVLNTDKFHILTHFNCRGELDIDVIIAHIH